MNDGDALRDSPTPTDISGVVPETGDDDIPLNDGDEGISTALNETIGVKDGKGDSPASTDIPGVLSNAGDAWTASPFSFEISGVFSELGDDNAPSTAGDGV